MFLLRGPFCTFCTLVYTNMYATLTLLQRENILKGNIKIAFNCDKLNECVKLVTHININTLIALSPFIIVCVCS